MCVKTALNALKIGHTSRLDSQFINILLIATSFYKPVKVTSLGLNCELK